MTTRRRATIAALLGVPIFGTAIMFTLSSLAHAGPTASGAADPARSGSFVGGISHALADILSGLLGCN